LVRKRNVEELEEIRCQYPDFDCVMIAIKFTSNKGSRHCVKFRHSTE